MGRYRIDRELGAGGMATVYLADVLTRATGQVLRLTRDGNSAFPEWNADGTRLGWLYGDATGASIRWQQAAQPPNASTLQLCNS